MHGLGRLILSKPASLYVHDALGFQGQPLDRFVLVLALLLRPPLLCSDVWEQARLAGALPRQKQKHYSTCSLVFDARPLWLQPMQ